MVMLIKVPFLLFTGQVAEPGLLPPGSQSFCPKAQATTCRAACFLASQVMYDLPCTAETGSNNYLAFGIDTVKEKG